MRQAMRLDPYYPASYLTRLGRAQFALGQYLEAVTTLKLSTERNPQDDRAHLFLAATYGHLNKLEEAKVAVNTANILRARTGWDDLTLQDVSLWKWAGDRTRIREGLIKAGIKSDYDWYYLITRTVDDFEISGVTKINVVKAKLLHERGVPFIDVGRMFFGGHISGAHNLPLYRSSHNMVVPPEFNERRLLKLVDKTQEIVIYSDSETANAANASAIAVNSGFVKVYYLENGLDKWKAAGYPVEKGK